MARYLCQISSAVSIKIEKGECICIINGLRFTGAIVSSKAVREANGRASDRYSRSIKTTEKKKLKKVQYNMRQISSRVLASKTSNVARMAWTGAKSKVAQLKRKLYSGEYDLYELEHAIIHAMRIERVAEKKMKHLQEEEAAKKGGLCNGNLTDKGEKPLEYAPANKDSYSDDAFNDVMLEIERNMQQRMQRELQDEIQKILQEINEIINEDIYEELSSSEIDIDPDDLEAMKKKHRSQELRDIIEADMKYLKAMFDRIQREQDAGVSGETGALGASNTVSPYAPYGQSVSLEIGGAKLPIEEMPPPDIVVRSEGTSIDVQA